MKRWCLVAVARSDACCGSLRGHGNDEQVSVFVILNRRNSFTAQTFDDERQRVAVADDDNRFAAMLCDNIARKLLDVSLCVVVIDFERRDGYSRARGKRCGGVSRALELGGVNSRHTGIAERLRQCFRAPHARLVERRIVVSGHCFLGMAHEVHDRRACVTGSITTRRLRQREEAQDEHREYD